MSMSYIRRTYGVPAVRGRRVTYTLTIGGSLDGTIVGARNGILRVRFDGDKKVTLMHPTWCLTYLPYRRNP